LLEKIRKFDEKIPVIVISGIKEVKIVVEAIKKGEIEEKAKKANAGGTNRADH
jgi:FixJ family two-component response regulator